HTAVRPAITPPPAPRIPPPVPHRPWRNAPTQVIAAVDVDSRTEADQQAPRTRLQRKKQHKQRRTVVVAKTAAVVLAALVFLGAGGAWGTKAWYDSKFTEVAALDVNSAHIQDAPGQLGDENFLIVGSDIRAEAEPGEGIGNAGDIPGARSDTVMLAHVPADRERAVVVSFPRDLEVARPACNRWDPKAGEYTDEVVPGADTGKLNQVYAVGGPRCVLIYLQRLTGLKINHFVGIDFTGFQDMVDAVGGVGLTIDQPIVDDVLGEIAPEPGEYTFTGKEALDYVRARHVFGDPTSDYGRIKRQQKFISALLGKTMSREVLFDPVKLTGFVNAFAASTFGDNIGVDQLLTLAQSMKGLDTDRITFRTVPTVGYANERGNEVLLPEPSADLFRALIDNSALPGSEPAPSTPRHHAQPGDAPG
ncbi:MAG: LCP family protein, partial [Pseudonocardiaceae bacterium]